MEAIEKAGEYLFAFFWKEDDENTKAMRSLFDAAVVDFGDRAQAVAVKVTEPEQEEIVEQSTVQSPIGLCQWPMRPWRLRTASSVECDSRWIRVAFRSAKVA